MIEALGPDSLSALEISGDYWRRWAPFKEYTRWRAFRPWLYSLRNEPEFPVSVWALARK